MLDTPYTPSSKELLQQLTKNQDYVFLVTPFADAFQPVSNQIKASIEEKTRLACFRADDLRAAGTDLMTNVHTFIDNAILVVAILSNQRPSVFYEVGYAIARGKHVITLIHVSEKDDVAADLRGRTHITYEIVDGTSPTVKFSSEPFEHVELLRRHKLQILPLSAMLTAPEPAPCIIVASPALRSELLIANPETYAFPPERTWGDNLGILGLAGAIGNILGERAGLELLPAQNHFPNLEKRSANLYLIGSGKVNPLAEVMLERLQAGRMPHFTITQTASDIFIHRILSNNDTRFLCEWRRRTRDHKRVPCTDYGIIVRGPHPEHPHHLVMVLAGAHSLGTGAACLAATQSYLVRKVIERFPNGTMPGPEHTIWVLVSGKLSNADGFLDPEGVEILGAGTYK